MSAMYGSGFSSGSEARLKGQNLAHLARPFGILVSSPSLLFQDQLAIRGETIEAFPKEPHQPFVETVKVYPFRQR